MTRDEVANQMRKSTIGFTVGGFRPKDILTASWVGKVTVKKKGESWPYSNDKPMIPICQLNLSVLENIPDNLKDIALITLFIDATELPDEVPNGDGWLLRAYSDINELVESEQPDVTFPIKAFQLKENYLESDFPCWEDCPIDIPDEFDDDYYELFPNQEGIKIGGWPTLVQSEIHWAPLNHHPAEPEYVFQIDSLVLILLVGSLTVD